MTEKQAFNDWHTKLPFPTGYEAVGVEAMYICWKAACEYQREIDAAMLDSLKMHSAALEVRANKGD